MDDPMTPWVHYWEKCVGSGHALLGLRSDWQRHLKIVRDELGFEYVRFHGILNDDLSVLQVINGEPYYSYYNIDSIYDYLQSIGMKPVVELSFMPQDIAMDPTKTVFHYKGITSPPKDWTAWTGLVKSFVSHLIDRYGLAEVSTWYFEVWNEPNCGFWSGTYQQYFYLLQITEQVIHSISPSLKVGGPASCQSGLINETMAYINNGTFKLDFISTHLYPTDFTPLKVDVMKQVVSSVRSIVGDMPLLYTEYNDGLYGNPPLHDTPFASAFIFKNLVDVEGLVEMFSWWTFTDIFEEGGQDHVLFNKTTGWGLLALYDIPKPSFRAFQLLHQTGQHRVAGTVPPDFYPTAGAMATSNQTHLTILAWNHQVPGEPIGTESLSVSVSGYPISFSLPASIRRIDDQNGNPYGLWLKMGAPQYPTAQQIEALMGASELQSGSIPYTFIEGNMNFQFDLPPQGVASIVVSLPLQ
uniref:Glycosyl hydrolases family 39 N-terminal catalytic domain-containing protein n=1 Tax=Arcella intermedia TaxID=1963864 RepID=A0A6B2L339_9EUKA